MTKNFFILISLISIPFIFFAQEENKDEDPIITLKKNRMYVADNMYDTVNFYLDQNYKFGWLLLTGTDVDEDKDGDFTDFIIILNDNVLIDTASMAEELGLGKDGKIETTAVNVSGLLKKGKNTLIIGSTEDEGQTDFVAMKEVELYCSKRNLATEITISSAYTDAGYEASVKENFEVKGDKPIEYQKTFYKDYKYYITAFPADDSETELTLYLYNKDGILIEKEKSDKDGLAFFVFKPNKKTDGKIVVKVKSKDKNPIIDLWVFYKEL